LTFRIPGHRTPNVNGSSHRELKQKYWHRKMDLPTAKNESPKDQTLLPRQSIVRDDVVGIVYNELRRIAAKYLRDERPDHTLQPTALVHEAYLRLIDQQDTHWQSEEHFIALAAMMMRRVLMNYAKSHNRQKRGGGHRKIAIDQADIAVR